MKWSAWFSAFSGIDADLSTTVTRQPCVSSRLIDGLAMIATIRIVVIILIAFAILLLKGLLSQSTSNGRIRSQAIGYWNVIMGS